MTSETVRRTLAGRLIIPGVTGMFLAPLLLAWWLLHFTEFGRDGAPSSDGKLIVPSLTLPDAVLVDPLARGSDRHLHGKWSLVYVTDDVCGKQCEYGMYEMRQLRLALGQDAERVQRVLLFPGKTRDTPSDAQMRAYPGQLLLHGAVLGGLPEFRNAATSHSAPGLLYLVDPLGNLVVRYPPDASPAGIIRDLKRLLRYSRIG